MAQRTLGLDIGQSSIKGVVLEGTQREYELAAYYSVPYQSNHKEPEQNKAARKAAIEMFLEQIGPFDQVITSLPSNMSACTQLEFPFSDSRKIDQTLGFQLDDISPFDLEDLIYDYQFIQKDKESSRLLIGSAKHEQVGEYLEELKDAKIDPRYLMLDGLSYYHIFDEIKQGHTYPMWGVLDIGYQSSTLTIFRQSEDDEKEPVRVEMVRSLSRGTKHLEQAITKTIGISTQEAAQLLTEYIDLNPASPPHDPRGFEAVSRAMTPIITELRRSIASFQRKYNFSLSHLYISGDAGQIQNMAGFFEQRLGIPTEVLTLHELPTSEGMEWQEHQHFFMKAVGLALKGISRSRHAVLNFRKGQFSYKGDLQFLKERLGSLIIGAGILFFLLLFSIGTQFYVLGKEGQKLEVEIKERCTKIIGRELDNPETCIAIMMEDIVKARGKSKSSFIPRISSYDIFLEVYDRIAKTIKNEKIKIEITNLRITPTRFELEGDTDSFGSVSKIEQRLKSYRCFKVIKRGHVRRAEGKSKKVEFRIWSELSC